MNVLTCVSIIAQGQGAAPRVSVPLWLNGGQRGVILDQVCLDIEGGLSLPAAFWICVWPVRLPVGTWKKRKGLWIWEAERPPSSQKIFAPLFWKCLFQSLSFQLETPKGPFWSTERTAGAFVREEARLGFPSQLCSCICNSDEQSKTLRVV